jgi:hypothetical protein
MSSIWGLSTPLQVTSTQSPLKKVDAFTYMTVTAFSTTNITADVVLSKALQDPSLGGQDA